MKLLIVIVNVFYTKFAKEKRINYFKYYVQYHEKLQQNKAYPTLLNFHMQKEAIIELMYKIIQDVKCNKYVQKARRN